MFSAHFAPVEQENHNAQPWNFLELLRILPSSHRSAFLAGSLPTFAETESGWLTPPAGLKHQDNWFFDDISKMNRPGVAGGGGGGAHSYFRGNMHSPPYRKCREWHSFHSCHVVMYFWTVCPIWRIHLFPQNTSIKFFQKRNHSPSMSALGLPLTASVSMAKKRSETSMTSFKLPVRRSVPSMPG